jgi:hypothetical protein
MQSDIQSIFHSVIGKLHALNVTEKQLEHARFLHPDSSIAFDNWAFTYPLEFPIEAIVHLKDYLALKSVLEDSGSPIVSGAYEHVQMLILAQSYSANQRFKKLQVEKAKKRRGLTDDDQSSFELVLSFCRKPENRDRSATEMWPHFFNFLANQRLDPAEMPKNSLRYISRNGTVNMGARTFANLASRARKIIAKAT